jgi:hypothetical protein
MSTDVALPAELPPVPPRAPTHTEVRWDDTVELLWDRECEEHVINDAELVLAAMSKDEILSRTPAELADLLLEQIEKGIDMDADFDEEGNPVQAWVVPTWRTRDAFSDMTSVGAIATTTDIRTDTRPRADRGPRTRRVTRTGSGRGRPGRRSSAGDGEPPQPELARPGGSFRVVRGRR